MSRKAYLTLAALIIVALFDGIAFFVLYVEKGNTTLSAEALEVLTTQNVTAPKAGLYRAPIESSPPICPLIGNPQNPRSRLNIQQIQQANLDLMSLEMSKLGLSQLTTHIGLVDGNISAIVQAFEGSITIGLQYPVAQYTEPEEYREHWDHGVEVTDVISAAAPGSYIRSFQTFDGPHANDFDAVKSVRQACNEGDLVINLSASNRGTPLEYTYPLLSSELAERGCILVEASGNAGKHPEVSMSWERDFITVGALTLSGEEPGFSTPGVIYAPGVGWLLSNAMGEVHPHAGTSFAAPVVTAIAKNIYTVLMQSSDFNSTSLPEHAFVTQKILRESSHVDAEGRKEVDGYRAMLLAQHVRRNGIRSYIHLANETSRAYVERAMAAQLPAMQINRCSNISASTNCQAKAACYTQKRMYLAANEEASPVDWEDLRATASNSNEPALAYEWSVKLSPTAADPSVLQSFENSEQKQPAKVETDTPVQKSAPHVPGEGSWSYNGSTFTFTWDGQETHFLYETPSSAFISTKVRKGTSLFDGVKQGNIFVGVMSYMTNNDCRVPIGVPTRGEISDDNTRVTFHSKKPFMNTNCNIVGEQDDVVTLVFTGK